MDFFTIRTRERKDYIEVYPDFIVDESKDLLVRGGAFYAIWDEANNIWSRSPYVAVKLVDNELRHFASELKEREDKEVSVRYLSAYSSKSWIDFNNYLKKLPDTKVQLDTKMIFANDRTKREDYVSKSLAYPLEKGSCNAFKEIIGTLYDSKERAKIEWAIGSIVSGDSRNIQKFIVLYGPAGAGKSTVLHIIEKLFGPYCVNFEAKALASSSNAFSTEVFRSNPLVAIQHDGDLSKIEDNTKLNSIVSHEDMVVNEKFKSSYTSRMNCFLFMGTNQPVKITDAKSGVLRRLIDVVPSGNKIPFADYSKLMKQIDFELGAIAYYCLQVYKRMGSGAYEDYKPLSMMYKTNPFFNFVEDSYTVFKRDDRVTLKAAYSMYKEYCDSSGNDFRLPMYKFREELKNYFKEFIPDTTIDGKHYRSVYNGFLAHKFDKADQVSEKYKTTSEISLESLSSIFDDVCSDCLAQYASKNETPLKKWDLVTTTLSDIDTKRLHYVKIPENHIVIDFDLKDENGEKSLELNMEAASEWPKTYCETSKSGKGLHLHYFYTGDTSKLSRIYDEGIEIKVFTGKSSLRRKLVKCNNEPIATLNSGLPLKEEKKMIDKGTVKSERALRDLIKRNLAKSIHPGTKPSVDFIHKILEDAYNSDLHYDVRDMRPSVMAFANNSTNHAEYCLKLVNEMHFFSEEFNANREDYIIDELVFFDVEVMPNLFVIVWKPQGKNPVKMINPTPMEVGQLFDFKLVGFNCRRYDNHILYARYLGYTNEELYELSQRLINNSQNATFGEAWNLSYTDVYDFSSKKQSLKKFEIELGIHHQELGLRWDEPVPEDLWQTVADYCVNDVVATEAVFEARKADFVAREILADIAGMTVNDTTNSLTTRIIFGKEKYPNLVYTDLATGEQDPSGYERTDIITSFPGYQYKNGKNLFMGEDVGKGGYVYTEPGMYTDVALLDIASMHPHSILAMNCFGEYTSNFEDLLNARMAIKHDEYESARKMFNGKLVPYLDDKSLASTLAYALKIAINSVYGLTSASFDTPFRDIRNKNNIVALRGALFMVTLKHEVQKRGFTVAHIKTDSIKIPNATPEIIQFVTDFGKKYGYNFEHEATYSKMCLINKAVYIARYDKPHKDSNGDPEWWVAVGAQFQHPYVFKTLFSHKPIEFRDLCEAKTVKTALYLDMNEDLENVSLAEKELDIREWNRTHQDDKPKKLNPKYEGCTNNNLRQLIDKGHNYIFVGRAGSFCPMKPGSGGGLLVREQERGKYGFATGAKGYRWMESEMVQKLGLEDQVDTRYHAKLVDEAIAAISEYCDFEWFASDNNVEPLPWED